MVVPQPPVSESNGSSTRSPSAALAAGAVKLMMASRTAVIAKCGARWLLNRILPFALAINAVPLLFAFP